MILNYESHILPRVVTATSCRSHKLWTGQSHYKRSMTSMMTSIMSQMTSLVSFVSK